MTYWDFVNRKARVTTLDVIEFEPVDAEASAGIEVIEEQFDSMEELMEHVKQVMGKLE